MTGDEIEKRFNTFFVETLELDPAILKPESSLKNDIGLTSMDMTDIRLFVENSFGWKMTRKDAISIYTLADLYSAIESHISK